jgi:7,8-dihydropterin-6-yl-methyl-4-(beta-D-ribofuranosyl)aminobenzene 5'-phosphate synthase
MVRILTVSITILAQLACGIPTGLAAPADNGTTGLVRPVFENPSPRMPIITVVSDNNPHGEGLKTTWGFSCLVEGMDKTILFDTGGDGGILLANMRKLGIAPRQIDSVVISHIHGDHVRELPHLLRENRQIVTYLPGSFPESFNREVKKLDSRVVPVHGPLMICERVFSTGELGTMQREQALVVRTGRGLVIVTGCAHPGIEKVVRMAKERFGGEILLVIGGFHLANSTKAEIEAVIAGLKKLGVRHVAPCHCTGDAARRLFKQAYGSDFIDAGVGKIITTVDLR